MVKEEIPRGVSQRCPKCKKLTCRFDVDTTSVICESCGFKETLRT